MVSRGIDVPRATASAMRKRESQSECGAGRGSNMRKMSLGVVGSQARRKAADCRAAMMDSVWSAIGSCKACKMARSSCCPILHHGQHVATGCSMCRMPVGLSKRTQHRPAVRKQADEVGGFTCLACVWCHWQAPSPHGHRSPPGTRYAPLG